MKPKDINQIIQQQTEDFFKEKSFKYSNKDMGYLKHTDNVKIRYGFSYIERRPQYYYEIYMYIRLNNVEEIYSKIDGTDILGETYVFPISYFLDKTDYIDKNPKFIIQGIEDVQDFTNSFIEYFTKYVKDFIPFITQPQNMLNFLLSEIETGKRYAIDEKIFIRSLILMKIVGDDTIEKKLKDFKEKLGNYREDIRDQYYKQMDNVVQLNY